MDFEKLEAFRRNLKKEFGKSGLNQGDFAKTIGIGSGYLGEILKGIKTGQKKIFDICENLGKPVSGMIDDFPKNSKMRLVSTHISVILDFNDQASAIRANKALSEIEKLDPDTYKETCIEIDRKLNLVKRLKGFINSKEKQDDPKKTTNNPQ